MTTGVGDDIAFTASSGTAGSTNMAPGSMSTSVEPTIIVVRSVSSKMSAAKQAREDVGQMGYTTTGSWVTKS